MLTVKPIESKEEQKKFCELCGIDFCPDMFAYAARVSGEFIGMSQFNIENGTGYIKDLLLVPGKDDDEALFIMGRATMNFIDLCGVHKCRADRGAGKIMKLIGFREAEDGTLFCDMTGMFTSGCGGKH